MQDQPGGGRDEHDTTATSYPPDTPSGPNPAPPDMIREFFLQDCDESTTEQVVSRLTRQSRTPFTQQPHQIAWQQKPATYFVCTEDLATPPEAQRQRVRADTRLVEFSAGITRSFASGRVRRSIVAAIDQD